MIIGGSEHSGLGAFCDAFLSAKTKAILRRLVEVEGLTTYGAVKLISKAENLATSTVKYVLAKLRKAGLVNYNGKVELTQIGLFIVNILKEVRE